MHFQWMEGGREGGGLAPREAKQGQALALPALTQPAPAQETPASAPHTQQSLRLVALPSLPCRLSRPIPGHSLTLAPAPLQKIPPGLHKPSPRWPGL